MRTRWTALVASLAALLLAVELHPLPASSSSPLSLRAIAHAAEVPAAALQPDADVQAKIAAVARATSEAEAAAVLAALRASASPDFADLVPQLALFLLDADGERAGMTPALIVSRLGITRGQILRAIAPHLDTPDAKLRAQLENLLGAVELEDVRTYLTERGATTPPSDGLVRYLYARSPADAVAVLAPAADPGARTSAVGTGGSPVAEVEAARAALASGRASDEQTARAAATLDALSRDPDWRLRAYAAAVLRAEPALAAVDAGALARATRDADSRVRAVATAPRPR